MGTVFSISKLKFHHLSGRQRAAAWHHKRIYHVCPILLHLHRTIFAHMHMNLQRQILGYGMVQSVLLIALLGSSAAGVCNVMCEEKKDNPHRQIFVCSNELLHTAIDTQTNTTCHHCTCNRQLRDNSEDVSLLFTPRVCGETFCCGCSCR